MKNWIQNKSSDVWQALLFVTGWPSDVIRAKTDLGNGYTEMLLSLPSIYGLSVPELAMWASLGSRSRMAPPEAEHALCVFLRARDQLKKPQPNQEDLSHVG